MTQRMRGAKKQLQIQFAIAGGDVRDGRWEQLMRESSVCVSIAVQLECEPRKFADISCVEAHSVSIFAHYTILCLVTGKFGPDDVASGPRLAQRLMSHNDVCLVFRYRSPAGMVSTSGRAAPALDSQATCCLRTDQVKGALRTRLGPCSR